MSDLLSLDEIDDDISEALDEDVKDVKEAEEVVEEQIDEDVEKAQQEADEEREEEDIDEEEVEQDEKDLNDVQDSLECFSFTGSDPVSKLLVKKTVERLAWRRGCSVPRDALEAFDTDDTSGLVEFVAEQREHVEKDRYQIAKARNEKRLSAWQKVDSALNKFIDLIKTDRAGVADLSDVGTMALKWEALSDTNRRDFEMLVNTHGHWVDDVITTLSIAKSSVRQMVEVVEAELAHYTLVQQEGESAPGYTHFLSDLKRGGSCLFKEPLIGAFNLSIDPVPVDDEPAHTYTAKPSTSVAQLTVSTSVGGVSDEALGDNRELEDLQELSLSILRIAKIACRAFVRLYESDSHQDAPCVSIHLVIRMLKLLIALRRTLSIADDQTQPE